MRVSRAPGDTEQSAACLRIPDRGTEPDQRRHEPDVIVGVQAMPLTTASGLEFALAGSGASVAVHFFPDHASSIACRPRVFE